MGTIDVIKCDYEFNQTVLSFCTIKSQYAYESLRCGRLLPPTSDYIPPGFRYIAVIYNDKYFLNISKTFAEQYDVLPTGYCTRWYSVSENTVEYKYYNLCSVSLLPVITNGNKESAYILACINGYPDFIYRCNPTMLSLLCCSMQGYMPSNALDICRAFVERIENVPATAYGTSLEHELDMSLKNIERVSAGVRLELSTHNTILKLLREGGVQT